MSYRRAKRFSRLYDVELPPNNKLTAKEIFDFLGETAEVVRDEWLARARAGTVTGMAPLSPVTVANKRRQGLASPDVPLVGTGALFRKVQGWQAKTSVHEVVGSNDRVFRLTMGPGPADDLECIQKDMFLGNPAVGKGHKVKVTARPIELDEAMAADAAQRIESWLRGLYGNDPEMFQSHVSRGSRWG